jgi:hypothetical protein
MDAQNILEIFIDEILAESEWLGVHAEFRRA